ncbi:MAG: M48 family metalloprotease [Desulfobacterales bacterium]|nr:MAG: M48 family metalloprotease [Desulfobacterales bacterium]
MKKLNGYAVLIGIIGLVLMGCAETSQIVGEVVSQQAYGSEYEKEYKKALARGMSEAEAQEYARKAAELKAGQKRQLFEGAGDVFTSAGEIDYNSELAIGESLALEGFKRYGLPVKDAVLQKYVNLVGNSVARNSLRSDIPYRFVVVESPLYNAFACPGGIIFLSSQLIKSMNDESELAGVLAHEVAHVTHKHALQSIKRARFFEGVGKITTASMKGEKAQQYQQMVDSLQTTLFDKGLDKSMEYQADITGLDIAYRTGYNPAGLIRVLTMLERVKSQSHQAGSWYTTHPPLSERLARCQAHVRNYPDADGLATVTNRFADYKRRLR